RRDRRRPAGALHDRRNGADGKGGHGNPAGRERDEGRRDRARRRNPHARGPGGLRLQGAAAASPGRVPGTHRPRLTAEGGSMISALVQEFLRRGNVPYAVFPHPPPFTAQEEAAVTHVPGRNWAKAV